MLQETSLSVVIAKHHSPTRSDSIIIGCNQAFNEQGNNLALKPHPMFEFGQGKKSVQVVAGNILMLEEALGKKKGSKTA